MVAIPLSSLLGSPISAALLQTDGMLGLRGWQWMFILEAIPAVLLGVAMPVRAARSAGESAVADRPSSASGWPAQLAAETGRARTEQHLSLWQVMTNKYVLVLALVYAGSSGSARRCHCGSRR